MYIEELSELLARNLPVADQRGEIIEEIGPDSVYEPMFVNLDKMSKLRIFCEAILFGCVIPAGCKMSFISALKPEAPDGRTG